MMQYTGGYNLPVSPEVYSIEEYIDNLRRSNNNSLIQGDIIMLKRTMANILQHANVLQAELSAFLPVNSTIDTLIPYRLLTTDIEELLNKIYLLVTTGHLTYYYPPLLN